LDRYVVIGNPVSHSKSPLIHACFAEQTGQDMQYSTLLAETGQFAGTVDKFFAGDGKGANVTVPFKQEAFALVNTLTPEAETAGAVNTLFLDARNNLCGHNTDGIGLVQDVIGNHGGSLANMKILVLGAGGATRGLLQPVMAQQPAMICIANRTVSKAEDLAQVFSIKTNAPDNTVIAGCGYADLEGNTFDWIINATSASLQGELPPLPEGILTTSTWCYDLMYSNEPTPFCRWAQSARAAKVMDGLGMLVEQAAESFLLWRGIRPHTAEILARLRQDSRLKAKS
jgi:shikimate dehydrogenase